MTVNWKASRPPVQDQREESPAHFDLRMWHIPQMGAATMYWYFGECTKRRIEEARLILQVLAMYDMFQLEHNIKPDYANAQGLQVYWVPPPGATDEESDWECVEAEDLQDINWWTEKITERAERTLR